MGKIARVVLMVVVAGALLYSCKKNTHETPTLAGSWSATESIEVFGRALATAVRLTIEGSAATLEATTSDGGTVVHRLVATGAYTATGGAISFSFGAAQQSTDNGDGTFAVDTLVDLSAADLDDLATDYPAGLTYTLDGSSLVLTLGDGGTLDFAREE